MGLLDQPKTTLNPTIWTAHNILKPEIKREILDKLFLLLPKNQIKQVWFIGSNASLQYNEFSDVDINVISRIPREDKENLHKIHKIFKKHNYRMNYLSNTKHPINYFIQPDIICKWSDELSSIYLIQDFDTQQQDSWAKLPKSFENIEDPEKKFLLNFPYARLTAMALILKLNELFKDFSELNKISGKQWQAKLQEVEQGLESLATSYKKIDLNRKLQYRYEWGIPKESGKSFLYKYLERIGILHLMNMIKENLPD